MPRLLWLFLPPRLLEEAGPFPLKDLYDRLSLQLVERRLSLEGDLLATCVLEEGPVEVFGPEGAYREFFPAGTVVVDPRTRDLGLGAWRNTLAHEAIHWVKDRPFLLEGRQGQGGPLLGRMEWQTHRLAPRVLMPWGPFSRAFDLARRTFSRCRPLLDHLADLFLVSRASVVLRIRELGLTKALEDRPDWAGFLPPDRPPQPYTAINPQEAEDLLANQPALRDRVEEEGYVYVFDGYFIKNDPAFLCRDGSGTLRVKSEGRAYLARCALNIWAYPGRSYAADRDLLLPQRCRDHIDKRLLVYHPDFQADDHLQAEEAYEAVQKALASYDEDKEKAFLKIITDPDLSLCQSLSKLMAAQGWKYPRQFEEATRLHKNYFGLIHKNDYNGMGKDKLMSLCVGLGLNLYLTFRLFEKAGMVLHRYQDPDRTYIKILEHAPGLPLDDFNGILEKACLEELGSVLRS